MTRILITGINYAPEETGIGPYTARMAEHLSARGYEVTVVTGMPHYPAWRIDDAHRGTIAEREIVRGVDVRRRWHYVPSRQSAVRRAMYEATFAATGMSSLDLEAPHAVLGITPSLGGAVVARAAAARFRVPYGLVVQDLVSNAAEQSGIAGGRIVSAPTRLVEGWTARGAAAVGIVAEGFRPHVEAMGVDAGRVRRVRNWTHTGEATVDRATMRAWLGLPQDAVVCLHAGNMGFKQGLDNVVACARIASATAPQLLFVLMGDGNQRDHLERLTGEYGLENLRFLPLQDASLFPSVLGSADVLLVNQRASVADMSLPSKLASYFNAGRPVVAAVAPNSETATEVMASGGGVVVAAEDANALLAAILRVAGDDGLAKHLASSGRRWARTVLAEEAALRTYEQLIATVLSGSGRGRVHLPEASPALPADAAQRRAA